MPIRSPYSTLLLTLAFTPIAFGQTPSIASGGVVNAASWSNPLAPGEMVAIFGTNLAAGQQSASAPLPNTLGGTSVTINGVPAPLAFVSPTQINAQVPSSLVADSSLLNTDSIVVKTAAGTSTPALTGITSGAPGFFTADASGCGQAAALNVKPDGTASLNSPFNSAAPGDYIALFGTGFGLAAQQPPDGAAATSASPLQTNARLFVDGNPVASLAYQGLAPALVGVDQINFQIPASTRNGCSVPVAAAQTLGSSAVTISVHNGRGQCSDPPIQSWGQVLLSASNFSGPGAIANSFNASFPASPIAQPPASEAVVFAPNWIGGVSSLVGFILSAAPINFHSCQVPGYSNLSAGEIQIQPPTGNPMTIEPQTLQSGGVAYAAALPDGFVAPGVYTITGTPGNSVNLNARLVVGAPIQIQTSLAPGAIISSSHPLTIQWTGGDAGSLVRLALYSQTQTGQTYTYSYADASSGSLTITPDCSSGATCNFGLPLSSNAQISIEVVPKPGSAETAIVPGTTAPVQLNWQYSYNFPGLILGQ